MIDQSASMQSLLAMFDVESSEVFLKNAAQHDGTTFGNVHMQLWQAFNNFEMGEQDYLKALASLSTNVEREMKYVLKGNTADSTWIEQASKQAASATEQMAAAVKTIHVLRSIYRTL